MRRIVVWTAGTAGIVVVAFVAFLVARTVAPCSLPPQLPGAADACALKAARLAENRPSVPLPPVITVAAVASRNFTDRLFVSGTLVARDEAIVGAQMDGLRILEVSAEDGDTVKQGQVLARLDRSQLDALIAQNDATMQRSDASIGQAESQIQQLEANLSQANSEFERSQKLTVGVISQATLDQRATALRAAQAQVEAARGALAVARADKGSREAERRELMVRVGRTEVKAPVGGIVSRRTAKVGAMASAAGEGLFRIITDGAIDLEAEVAAEKMAVLKTGMTATLTVPGIATPLTGAIRLVSEEVDKTSRTGKVRIALPAETDARIGAFASGTVQIVQRAGLGVPTSALQAAADGSYVQVVVNDAIDRRKVTTGIVEAGFAEVRTGLVAGETVVARAAAFLRHGDLVRPKMAEPQTAQAGEAGK